MNFLQLCHDHGIETAHPEEEWVGVHCPFCVGSRDYHLGFHQDSLIFSCWRCGVHDFQETLERLTGEPFHTLWSLYGKGTSRRPHPRKPKEKEVPALTLPDGFLQSLRAEHRKYLKRRGFNPEELEQMWGLHSTTPSAMLGGMEYKNRIFIPAYWDEKMVSFLARTPSKVKQPRYKNCVAELETISLKKLIYRHPKTVSPYGIAVEGPTDVWRMGKHSFALMGIGFSTAQVKLIAEQYKTVRVIFDKGEQAQHKARELRDQLRMHGLRVDIHELQGANDCAELHPDESRELVNDFLQHLS